ncbi:hypothetical protein HZB96_04820 [Candidatus Gottesmanbacteria bacterium]|nr:hypothetical protein [Candidatus Gottesmanbacteria bacterium]MBI5452404.1 hypothetical protein [Candidatus Gottesmanbacteria bacterium]
MAGPDQLDANLPEIRVLKPGGEGDDIQVVVSDPQSVEEPIEITIPPETDTT